MDNYFQAYSNYFWQWEKEEVENIVAIPLERTIAYESFLGGVIEKLAPQGLPPFGSLLLAIVATNPGGSDSIDAVYSIISRTLKTTDDTTLAKAVAFLRLLSEVPRPYKQGEKRLLLFQALFERCHNILSIKDSESVYLIYKKGNAYIEGEQAIPINNSVFDKDFRTISLLGTRFETVDSIIEKMAGLPNPQQYSLVFEDTPGEAPAPIALDFVDELINDAKTFTVGSLIRWLWGGLNIPVHSTLPSQQPLGGISDLTNKGDYDKLLVSEFANDDLVFLSRLANNEALYIHREVPPASYHLQRVILVDVTLKNWGTPKVIAFATMLAIVKHPKTDIDCITFVVGGSKFHQISTESIHTIIDALQILEGSLHPAYGLETFLKEHGADKNKEIFFITESSNLKQAALLKVMNDYRQSIHYLLLTDAQGNVDVYKKHQHSKKHLQHIRLPLDEAWKKRPREKQSRSSQDRESAVDYPILLRHTGQKKITEAPDGEIFQMTEEKSLLRYFDKSAAKHTKGWDLVLKNLPYKTEHFEVGMTPDGHHLLLMHNVGLHELSLINITTGEKKVLHFDRWKSTAWPSFVFSEGKFYHTNHLGISSISVDGTLSFVDTIDVAKFEKKASRVKELLQNYSYGMGVFKNVNKVFINSHHELVFNIHTLRLNSNGIHIKLGQTTDLSVKKEAQKNSDTEFTFENGSSVVVDRSGILILKSPNEMIPDIYIPTALDTSLGVATWEEFAGNDYYYKESQNKIIVTSAGANKIAVIKQIKDSFVLGLKESRDIVDSAPAALQGVYSEGRATQIKKDLEAAGATVELKPMNGSTASIRKVSPAAFFKKNYERYINIVLNGA